jgi:hypothetical protein
MKARQRRFKKNAWKGVPMGMSGAGEGIKTELRWKVTSG